MKGIVFTELIEMVEAKWGLEMSDKMLDPEGLSSGGVFTAVGTYPDMDIVIMLTRLRAETGLSIDQLQNAFGRYLFGTFARAYGEMLSGIDSTFSMLSRLDDFIHPEVRKLYPDAELPGFEIKHRDDSRLEMIYTSSRKMPHFAEGLIYATAEHFEEQVQVNWAPLDEDSGIFRFEVVKMP
ncbi:MAG: heme NO-binding domain-containing protein [Bacteroidota bacterium]